jgi:hypothetical protein
MYARDILYGDNGRGPTEDCYGIHRYKTLSLRGSGTYITAPHTVSYVSYNNLSNVPI